MSASLYFVKGSDSANQFRDGLRSHYFLVPRALQVTSLLRYLYRNIESFRMKR